MKKKIILSIFLAAALFGTSRAAQEGPSENIVPVSERDIKTRVVRIRGYEGVSPLNLFIAPGTVVVWLNQYGGEIKVRFPGKKVTLACKSPVNFTVSDEGTFVSNDIAYGAVASLCFVEPGSFDYFIERTPSSIKAKTEGFRFEGKIVVQ